MQLSNFIIFSIFITIFCFIAIAPSDTFAGRPVLYFRDCGDKRCKPRKEVCVRQQIRTNLTSRIHLRPTCIKPAELPQTVTGPCARVLCLDGYKCVLPRGKSFFRGRRLATCKMSPILRKAQ